MLNPEWYCDTAQGAFVAFADGRKGCSRYDFKYTGAATRKHPIRRPGWFAVEYSAELRLMTRIGTLEMHLDIQKALTQGHLPDLVLTELRRKCSAAS